MKKIIIALSIVFANVCVFAQTKPAAKPAQPFVLNAKDSMLCKAWKVKVIERFNTKSEPSGTEKNDGLTFVLDQTSFVTIDGKTSTGKWVTDKAKTLITVTNDETKEIMKFRIKSLQSEELIVHYQDKELMTTVYTFVPSKK